VTNVASAVWIRDGVEQKATCRIIGANGRMRRWGRCDKQCAAPTEHVLDRPSSSTTCAVFAFIFRIFVKRRLERRGSRRIVDWKAARRLRSSPVTFIKGLSRAMVRAGTI
jgi:hypothetical protein